MHGVQGGSRVSSDIYRLLLGEEEDDATSALAAPKPEPVAPKNDVAGFQEVIIFLEIKLVHVMDSLKWYHFQQIEPCWKSILE